MGIIAFHTIFCCLVARSSVQVTPESSLGTAFESTPWATQLSGTDLINSGRPYLSKATVTASNPNFPGTGINNGAGSNAVAVDQTFFAAGSSQFPATATYDLNLTIAPQGYNITSIQSFMGWKGTASKVQANQTYKVSVKYLGALIYTEIATVNYNPFPDQNGSNMESRVVISDTTGTVATGVDSLKFEFSAPLSGVGGSSNGTVIREIDVFGTALGVLTDTVLATQPVSRQIVQRGGNNRAGIPITGVYYGSPDRIEARAVVMTGSGNTGTDSGWTTIQSAPAGGVFSGVLPDVAAGGWYQVEVRGIFSGIAGPAGLVTQVGVGDIYITCGQSNSANYGSPIATASSDQVSAFNYSTSAWTRAADPMPGAGGSGGSVWSRLGDLLAARDHVPVAFACLGVGSTSVSQWVPGTGSFYSNISTAIQKLKSFRAILWHQGESDSLAPTTTTNYATRLQNVIAQSRADAGFAVPWYVCEVGFHSSSGLAAELRVNAGQRRVIYGDDQVFAGPRTDDFHLEGKLTDAVHFNAQGLADHAAQWRDILGGNSDLQVKNGNFESNTALADGAVQTVSTTDLSSPSVIGWQVLDSSKENAADGTYGYYNPDDSSYLGSSDNGTSVGVLPGMSGRHVGYLSNSTAIAGFLQTRRETLASGQTYTLTVALGVRSNGNTFGGAVLEILADGVVVGTRVVSLADLNAINGGDATGKFTEVSVSASTGTSTTSGKAISIRIAKSGGTATYLDFDNVRLSVRPTPFAAWQVDRFGSPSVPAAAWSANPAGDQLANCFKYYMGLDPNTHDESTYLSQSGGNLVYSIPLNPGVDTSGLHLWYSFDLGNWLKASSSSDPHIIVQRTGTQWSVSVDQSVFPKVFFRLTSDPLTE